MGFIVTLLYMHITYFDGIHIPYDHLLSPEHFPGNIPLSYEFAFHLYVKVTLSYRCLYGIFT